ncbi:MAG: hypothetical protein HY096_09440 [Nitrospinae bacterium]|nr:hypothetical protein [Nitrospinota bacterium]
MPSFRTPKGKTVNYRIVNDGCIYTEGGTDLKLKISGDNVYRYGSKVGPVSQLDVLCMLEYKKLFPDS